MSSFRYLFFVFMCLFTILLGLNKIMSNSLVFVYITLYVHYLFIREEDKTQICNF
jgi:hypothetical protein